MEFVGFPKIPRLSKANMVITEKIDGTNGQIIVGDNGELVAVGSRNRWISPDSDNYGFARWVQDNPSVVQFLGRGTHFGEWFGNGIQRGYGLNHKRFALFNVHRWGDYYLNAPEQWPEGLTVVPKLYAGPIDLKIIEHVMEDLLQNGSKLVPDYRMPEGVIIYFTEAKSMFKKTFDDQHKG